MFKYVADLIIYRLIGLVEGEKLTDAAYFFVYDVLKILILVFAVVAFIAFLRTFIDSNKLKKTMEKSRFGLGNIAASLFGAATPFCSCSSIPLFIGFLKARVPVGIAFSFLITSPLVNEVAFVIMGGLFGWKLASMYALAGIVLGVVGGLVIGALGLEKEIILDKAGEKEMSGMVFKKMSSRLKYAYREGKKIFKTLWLYVIGGVALGAIIHGYVPQEFFMNYVGKYEFFAVPMAVLLGVPIYAGCSTIAPVIFSITAGGVPLGTSLAFMMSIAGLSLPEAVMLKKVLSMRLLVSFFGIVSVGIVLVGWLFNVLA